MYSIDYLDKMLETYSLAELLEYNDVSDTDVLVLLDANFDLIFPPKPVDLL